MTTQTYTSVVDHTGDAGFRAWGSELDTNLAAAGLVQTADTGQINWGTVARPGASTAAGYTIWRLANSSLYFKIEYGTGTGATVPQMWITVGTGSNGSGTLTGQLSTRNTWTVNAAPTSTVATYTTYICVLTDAITVVWKANGFQSSATAGGFLCVGRSTDSDGVTTSQGYCVIRPNVTTSVLLQSVRTQATATTYNDSNSYAVVPGAPTSSALQNGDLQVYQTWANLPDVQPFLYACIYVVAEVTELNTITTTLFGSTSHSYLAIGLSGAGVAVAGSNQYAFALIYE